MYSFDSRVRYSEVDYNGTITFHSILDYFQDCSAFQSEDIKMGVAYQEEHQVAWVLVSWQIQVERYPKLGERIRIVTWPYNFRAFYGWRNYLITDERGNCLACADSLWVLLDVKSGHPTRLLPEMLEAYQLEPPVDKVHAPRKLKLPEDMEAREPFAVQKYHLDTNHHVNNGKYILMAQEYLPAGFEIGNMRAEYKKSAVYGDIIYPRVCQEQEKTAVALCDEQGNPYVMIELERKND